MTIISHLTMNTKQIFLIAALVTTSATTAIVPAFAITVGGNGGNGGHGGAGVGLGGLIGVGLGGNGGNGGRGGDAVQLCIINGVCF